MIRKKIVIEAIYGLGELIVQGAVTPDHYEVSKTDFAIAKRNVAQTIMLEKAGTKNKESKSFCCKTKLQKITDEQIITLAKNCCKTRKTLLLPARYGMGDRR